MNINYQKNQNRTMKKKETTKTHSYFDIRHQEDIARRYAGDVQYYFYCDNPIVVSMDEDIYVYEKGAWKESKLTPYDVFYEYGNCLSEADFKSKYPDAYATIPDLSIDPAEDELREMKDRIEMVLYPRRIEIHFITALEKYEITDAELQQIQDALIFMQEKHKGQYRKEHTPYYLHCLFAALQYLEVSPNVTIDGVQILLLHDVLEDTDTSYAEIEAKFGKIVADAVNSLSKKRERRKIPEGEYYEAISNNAALAEYKTFDRLANICSLKYSSNPEFITRYKEETRRLIFPLVEKLDNVIKEDFKKVFEYIENYPNTSTEAKERLQYLKELRNNPNSDSEEGGRLFQI